MNKKRKQKTLPPLKIRWRYGAWLNLSQWLTVARQNALADKNRETAHWLHGLSQHIAAACDNAAKAAGEKITKYTDLEDMPVVVLLKPSTARWLESAGIILPPPEKPQDPAIKETADLVRGLIEKGEIDA